MFKKKLLSIMRQKYCNYFINIINLLHNRIYDIYDNIILMIHDSNLIISSQNTVSQVKKYKIKS